MTWENIGQDGSTHDIFGQRYNADGTTNGYEFQINTYTNGNQRAVSVSELSDGRVVVTWTSDDAQDGDGLGVFAKILPQVDNTFTGSDAVEVFDGGAGGDTVDFSNSDAAVSVDLLNGTASGGFAAGDTLISIENIIGTDLVNGRDWIWGDNADNHIRGLDGPDILEGGAGADIIDGGDGWDYSRYTRSSEGGTVNLETGVNTGGDAQGDIILNVEAVVGSAHDDTLTGGSSKNYLRGEDGDDVLDGGLGNDQLFGG